MKIPTVEADPPIAMTVCLPAHAGCETEVAATGKKAMNLAQDHKFDLEP